MRQKKGKILYIYTADATFVQRDIEMLSKKFQVVTHSFYHKKKRYLFFLFLKEFFFLLKNIWRSKGVITMFGGYHSFLPSVFSKLFNKKNYIILGGTDCVSFPSINYGNFRKQPYAWFTKWSYKLSTHLLPVHESLIFYNYTYYDSDFSTQGCKAFCPDLQTPYTVIYNGFDSTFWRKEPSLEKRNNQFVTIASMRSDTIIKLKGIDLILKIAERFPECTFHIVGVRKDVQIPAAVSNVKFHPFADAIGLRNILSESRFYLQLSISEGFPNALCEAMLCECVPIGSRVGGIPTIIGNTGKILEKRDLFLLESILKEILSEPDLTELGRKARSRVAEEFTFQKREQKLIELF